MINKPSILCLCLIAMYEAAPDREIERQELEKDIQVGMQILRDTVKFTEDGLKQGGIEDVLVVEYEDTSSFKRNLANLVFWQAVRLAPGFDEATVNANEGEKELIRIAKYLSDH